MLPIGAHGAPYDRLCSPDEAQRNPGPYLNEIPRIPLRFIRATTSSRYSSLIFSGLGADGSRGAACCLSVFAGGALLAGAACGAAAAGRGLTGAGLSVLLV